MTHATPGRTPSLPMTALICAVILIALALGSLLFVDLNDRTTPVLVSIIGLIVTSVPALIAAAFSERASRDIRNGVVVDKVREGASQALVDHQVITRDGPAVSLQMAALAELLRTNTAVTRENTANNSEGSDNG